MDRGNDPIWLGYLSGHPQTWWEKIARVDWVGERRREFEKMRRLSDNFGYGPILRYGEDRYGGGA